MKLQKILLENYRNFKDYSIDFGIEATIFIGKNGMGKTNLLSAIAHSLSFVFTKKRDEIQYDFIASSDESVKSFDATDARYNYENDNNGNFQYPLSIKTIALEDHDTFEWEFYKENDTSGLDGSRYRNANTQYWRYYIGQRDFPVFAYFYDSYPHVTASVGTKIQEKLDSGNPLPPNTAYYRWNDERNCTDLWVQYFTMHWKNIKFENPRGDADYISCVSEKITDFSTSISELSNDEEIKVEKLEVETRGRNDVLIVVFKNGNRTPFIQLPQGYKRIFSIVFDIANRAYLLNSNCNPSGIVMIDEIELHLHPSIAQVVLNALKRTFPKIQFIVSTHSPLVITNFKQDDINILYKLYNEDGEYKNERIANLYGIDYNSGLRDWMDASFRKSKIDELLKAYEYWEKVGNEEKMNRIKAKIQETTGENSELYKSL